MPVEIVLPLNQLLAVADDTASAGIKLCNYKADLLSLVLGQILFVGIRYQAGRNKYAGLVYYNAQAALQHLSHGSGQYLSALKSFFQTLAALLSRQALIGQENLSLSIIHLQHLYFHGVTHVDAGRQVNRCIAVLALGQDTV